MMFSSSSEVRIADLPVVLAGIGGAAWWVLEGFKREQIDVEAFVVSKPEYETEETCQGLPVWKRSSWKELPRKQSDYVVVIAVMNPKVDIEVMRSDFKANGWTNTLDFTEYARTVLKERGINVCMLNPKEFSDAKEELLQLKNELADAESILTLDGFCSYVEQISGKEFPKRINNPYFVNDIRRWNEELSFVDCGAYDGDSLKQALRSGYKIKSAFCFEPDPRNFHKLVGNLKGIENVVCLPLAVSDKTEMKSFTSQNSTGSKLVSEGENYVQCVSLDEFMDGCEPNLIKMDIEGGELDALMGAAAILEKYRPNLAISVYHKTNDIWQIPGLISSIIGPCNYFLRRHSRTIADTVLYVFPE